MREIDFSIMFQNEEAEQRITELIQDFEKKYQIKVNLNVFDWVTGWGNLIRIALYNDGPHISEIGTSWISDFARMMALRPFSTSDIKSLGGSNVFASFSWRSSQMYGQPEIWSIPLMIDTRILFYRKDLLQEAGIDEKNAFGTSRQLVDTLQKLQASGVEIPWIVPTQETRITLHHVASWIWGAGGNFLSKDGTKALVDSPEAIQALTEYFSLVQFMGPEARNKSEPEAEALYQTGKAAVTLSGSWLIHEKAIDPEVRKNTGFTSPPGTPFFGGNHLVIWKHTIPIVEAIELIRFLTGPEVQLEISLASGMLPANANALSSPHFSKNEYYKPLIDRLKKGRTFRSVPNWGMVEERLSSMLTSIWREILESPDEDIGKIVKKHVKPLNTRLNMTLARRS